MGPTLLVWKVVVAAVTAWVEPFAFDFVPSGPVVLDVNSDVATFPEAEVEEGAYDAVA